MLPSELKIGVIGLGKMGMLHLEKLSLNNRIALSGVWDITPQRPKQLQNFLMLNLSQIPIPYSLNPMLL